MHKPAFLGPCSWIRPFEAFPRGADGFGTGSGCRLITCSGPQMHATAIDVAALLGDAAGGRSASPKPRRSAEEAPRGRAKSLGARSGHFGGVALS